VLSIPSQLLYVACRPIYVVLNKLSEKQIDELKRNPSKYKSAKNHMPKISLTRKSGPACKTKPRKINHHKQNVFASLKPKAPLGDESDPIVVEDEGADISTSTATTKEALIEFNDVKSCFMYNAKSIKKRKYPSSTVTLIDLCSSDEEEDSPGIQMRCDENKDPMNSDGSSITKSFLRKFMPKQALYGSLHLSRTFIDCTGLVIEQGSERR